MASILELMGHARQGFADGKQQGQQTRLGQLAGQAYTAPQDQRSGILSQMATIDPRAAQSQQQQFRTGDNDRVAQLSQKAKLFVGLAKAGDQQAIATLYPQIAQGAKEAFGIDVSPTYDPSFLAGIEQFANLAAGQQGTGVQSTYIDDKGQRIAILRDGSTQVLGNNAPNNQIIDTGNGFYGVNKGNLRAAPVQVGGAPQQQPPASQGDPQASQPNRGPGSLDINADLQQFASLGIPVTSTKRTPDKNRSVGGVGNSYHLSGEAVDMAPQNPQQKQQARQFWESKGYQVIDEGDHLHAEPPARGMTVSQLGGGQQLRSAPKPISPIEQSRLDIEQQRLGLAVNADQRATAAANQKAHKPMPPAIFKQREATLAEAETAKGINMSLDKHLGRLNSGKLQFGPVANLIYAGLNKAGNSTEESRNFAEFKSDLEKLRNDSLRLNSGVQTDGDAQRAWNELFADINDTDLVKQRLATIRQLNERAEMLKRASVERTDEEYGGVGNGSANDDEALIGKYLD